MALACKEERAPVRLGARGVVGPSRTGPGGIAGAGMALACEEEPGDWSVAAADDVIVSPPASPELHTLLVGDKVSRWALSGTLGPVIQHSGASTTWVHLAGP